MKKISYLLIYPIFAALLLSIGCAGSSETDDETGSSGQLSPVAISAVSTKGKAEGDTLNTATVADDVLVNSSFTQNITISFSGTAATVSGNVGGVSASINGADVTITSSAKNVQYILDGTTTNGSVKIYSAKKCQITLNGVDIANDDGPALNIQPYNDESGRVFVVLNDGTSNSLEDGLTYSSVPTSEDAKGTIFAEGKLIFSGKGTLMVKGNYKHGIASDDYVRIEDGTITIANAITDGIHANDAIIVDGGTVNITASSDGIESEEGYIVINGGTFNLNVADDGIVASYDLAETGADQAITPYVTINGGTFVINAASGEGIESKSVLTINNGDFTVKVVDDGLNAAKSIYINDGKLYVYSTGNDAIDSNGLLTMTGGMVIAIGAASPEEGFDCDQNTFKITGGTLLGIAGASSLPTASVSTQNSVILGSVASVNQLVSIISSDGDEALTFLVPKSYTTMLYSSAKLKSNTSYYVYKGGTVSDGEQYNGLYLSGNYSGGTKSNVSFKISGTVTQVAGSTGSGGGGKP